MLVVKREMLHERKTYLWSCLLLLWPQRSPTIGQAVARARPVGFHPICRFRSADPKPLRPSSCTLGLIRLSAAAVIDGRAAAAAVGLRTKTERNADGRARDDGGFDDVDACDDANDDASDDDDDADGGCTSDICCSAFWSASNPTSALVAGTGAPMPAADAVELAQEGGVCIRRFWAATGATSKCAGRSNRAHRKFVFLCCRRPSVCFVALALTAAAVAATSWRDLAQSSWSQS